MSSTNNSWLLFSKGFIKGKILDFGNKGIKRILGYLCLNKLLINGLISHMLLSSLKISYTLHISPGLEKNSKGTILFMFRLVIFIGKIDICLLVYRT